MLNIKTEKRIDSINAEKEFNRQESIIIESFLDLYCHDCPDKMQCEGCRVSDVFRYLEDMGSLDEEDE